MPRRPAPDRRQPGLALVPARPRPAPTDADRAAAARKCRIGLAGEELWLVWRAERQQYCVARYDRAARSSRLVGTGIGPGASEHPPREAHEALAAHYAARRLPAVPRAPADVGVSTILTRYLAEHCVTIAASERQSYAVFAIERFLAVEQRGGAMITAAALGKAFVAGYTRFRRADGIVPSSIERELATLRAAVSWAAKDELIASKPFIPKMAVERGGPQPPKPVAYSLAQVAAILEAAWSRIDRRHVHLFIITMLATHGRTEAILECDLDGQYEDGVLEWLATDRAQTTKRRSSVPVAPVLADWLEGRAGKLIRCQIPIAEKNWRKKGVPEFRWRDAYDIHKAFEGCLLAAGAAHPTLRLRQPVLDAAGEQVVRVLKRRDGGHRWVAGEAVPQWQGVGYPNAIRHTIHTQLKRIGVPDGQIDAAAGHAQQGTGRHYNHFDARRDLKDFVAGVEQLFDELRRYTTCHLRTQCGPNVVDMAPFRAGRDG